MVSDHSASFDERMQFYLSAAQSAESLHGTRKRDFLRSAGVSAPVTASPSVVDRMERSAWRGARFQVSRKGGERRRLVGEARDEHDHLQSTGKHPYDSARES